MTKRHPPQFTIRSDVPMPTKGAGGRPRDPRLADICARAAAGLDCGQFDNPRDAANAFVAEYKGKAYDPSARIGHGPSHHLRLHAARLVPAADQAWPEAGGMARRLNFQDQRGAYRRKIAR